MLLKIEKKIKKLLLGQNCLKPTFRLYQKVAKNREKKSKIIVGSELSGTNRLHTKNRGKSLKNFFESELSETNNESTLRCLNF